MGATCETPCSSYLPCEKGLKDANINTSMLMYDSSQYTIVNGGATDPEKDQEKEERRQRRIKRRRSVISKVITIQHAWRACSAKLK